MLPCGALFTGGTLPLSAATCVSETLLAGGLFTGGNPPAAPALLACRSAAVEMPAAGDALADFSAVAMGPLLLLAPLPEGSYLVHVACSWNAEVLNTHIKTWTQSWRDDTKKARRQGHRFVCQTCLQDPS